MYKNEYCDEQKVISVYMALTLYNVSQDMSAVYINNIKKVCHE